jgi:hypothetical protein
MKKPQRKQLVPKPPVNIPVKSLGTVFGSALVNRLLTANYRLIHKVINSPADLEFLLAWFKLGAAKLRYKNENRFIVGREQWHTLSALGLLAMIAHTAAREGKAWPEFIKFVNEKVESGSIPY